VGVKITYELLLRTRDSATAATYFRIQDHSTRNS
jgi:hypothetical protein